MRCNCRFASLGRLLLHRGPRKARAVVCLFRVSSPYPLECDRRAGNPGRRPRPQQSLNAERAPKFPREPVCCAWMMCGQPVASNYFDMLLLPTHLRTSHVSTLSASPKENGRAGIAWSALPARPSRLITHRKAREAVEGSIPFNRFRCPQILAHPPLPRLRPASRRVVPMPRPHRPK